MMTPATLSALLAEGGVRLCPDGLEVETRRAWVVPGEDRLSATTILRLVECCREHHWQQDIVPAATGQPVDSITKSINAEFFRPVPVPGTVHITYAVTQVRGRGYELCVTVRLPGGTLCATVTMVQVFFDGETHEATAPPPNVHERLQSLLAAHRSTSPRTTANASS